MEQISIVKRCSRFLPILLVVILLALFVLAALWFLGETARANVGLQLVEPRTPAAQEVSSAL